MNKLSAAPSEKLGTAKIHPTADVSPRAIIGDGSRIWHYVQIREDARIGTNCIVGKDVYIDTGVQVGSNVKIQNAALLYQGATIEDGVFIGPQACLTNDRYPRAITPEGQPKGAEDWQVSNTLIRYGASIGAGAIIVAGVTIGCFAMVGAGAVVTHSVPDHGMVLGIPARLVGYVCDCGRALQLGEQEGNCTHCSRTIPMENLKT